MSIDISRSLIVKFVLVYFLIINLTGLIIMKIDKRKSIKHQWRVPEARIFIISILGGSVGVFAGMHLFHHKTKHPKFVIGIPAIITLQFCLFIKLFLF